ncbi:homoserine dehydrogenase [Alicyclobacillus fastidiosus]|uniref:Homoserine dehydrogenase n=1 Tax=Alicyclobacillus fastidiosus TaxID=392011 RepID=A0ABV5AAB6_9BACL|nr:homoserine dehydrogenase [Alicyclobacillus fastidiosus]WEH07663.1 homoserine dehydrogenase [Alicyclobacillus fastidiosus]
MAHKLAFIGFGTVGQGLAEILLRKQQLVRQEMGEDVQVVAISDAIKGSVYNPDGLDLALVLDVVKRTGSLESYPDERSTQKGWDSLKTIRETNADTIVEVTFTNVRTGQPAIDHCRAAFAAGKNVVTSNKGPAALQYAELSALAQEHGAYFGIEGTVMSGTPTLRMPLLTLPGNDITEIRGIFNGTTNYILTCMERGMTYHEALARAQQLGYAEADPTSDIEGYDAMYKVIILANVVMGVPLQPHDVTCRGIADITPADIQRAGAQGKRWKLVSRLVKRGADVIASVAPEMISLDDPLASVSGTTNAITYECDLIGPVTVMGAGAGRTETGFSLLSDLIYIAHQAKRGHGMLV